jgi:hypothetical protein
MSGEKFLYSFKRPDKRADAPPDSAAGLRLRWRFAAAVPERRPAGAHNAVGPRGRLVVQQLRSPGAVGASSLAGQCPAGQDRKDAKETRGARVLPA